MTRISLEVDAEQLEKALSQLDATEQLRLAKRLAARQLAGVVTKLRLVTKRKRLSAQRIDEIVQQARHEAAHRRHP